MAVKTSAKDAAINLDLCGHKNCSNSRSGLSDFALGGGLSSVAVTALSVISVFASFECSAHDQSELK